jgi:hypothetical protein
MVIELTDLQLDLRFLFCPLGLKGGNPCWVYLQSAGLNSLALYEGGEWSTNRSKFRGLVSWFLVFVPSRVCDGP